MKDKEIIDKIKACKGKLNTLSIAKVLNVKYALVLKVLYDITPESTVIARKAAVTPGRIRTDHGMLFTRTNRD